MTNVVRALFCLLWLIAFHAAAATQSAPQTGSEYIEMSPAFVVNVGSSGKIAFLKADVSLRATARAVPLVQLHMPTLRHALIMLFSRQEPEALAAPERREALRLEALDEVRQTLDDDGIQDLLFTSFIIQR